MDRFSIHGRLQSTELSRVGDLSDWTGIHAGRWKSIPERATLVPKYRDFWMSQLQRSTVIQKGILEIVCMSAQLQFTALKHLLLPKYILAVIWHSPSVTSERLWCDMLTQNRITLPCCKTQRGFLQKLSSRLQSWKRETEAPCLDPAAANHPFITNGVCFQRAVSGLPCWLSGKESTCQCRRQGFDPRSRKIPHAAGQLSRCAVTIEHVL